MKILRSLAVTLVGLSNCNKKLSAQPRFILCLIPDAIVRPRGDPQMIRFGAHLVLVLRYLLAEEMADTFREKIMTLGDLIIHM